VPEQHSPRTTVRPALLALLGERGYTEPVRDDQSLFFSGLLDSLAATEVMMMLESDHGIDLADADFDIARLDTIAELDALIADHGMR
jgi:acyl carrier protein